MADPVVVPAEGTTLSFGAALTGPWTALGGVISVTPPSPEVAAVKTTLLADTFQGYRPGRIPDMGEVTFRLRYDPNLAAHTDIPALLGTPATNIRFWKIEYNDDKTATSANDTFQAFVMKWEPDTDEDEKNLEVDVTLKLMSAITRTAGTNTPG